MTKLDDSEAALHLGMSLRWLRQRAKETPPGSEAWVDNGTPSRARRRWHSEAHVDRWASKMQALRFGAAATT